MNRRQRRAAKSRQGARPAPQDRAAPQFAIACNHHKEGRLSEAEALYRRILAQAPTDRDCRYQLGVVLMEQGKLSEAHAELTQVLRLAPEAPDVHASLATLHRRAGRWEDAVAHGERYLALQAHGRSPASVSAAHLLVGEALRHLRRLPEATAHFARITELEPRSAAAWYNLGVISSLDGRYADAVAALERAVALDAGIIEAYHRIAGIHYEGGDIRGALAAVRRGLAVRETADGRVLFAQCLQGLDAPLPEGDGELRALTLRALREPWARPNDLAPVVIATLVRDGIERSDLHELARNELLCGLLATARVAHVGLEAILTRARSRLLGEKGREELLPLCCALARQCFLNEYVYLATQDDHARLDHLRERVETGLARDLPIAASDIAVLAAFVPLRTVRGHDRLRARTWPAPLEAIVVQQLVEPAEERAIRIPALTPIVDDVSQAVRRQYEANPYPRWVAAGPPGQPLDLNAMLSGSFPRSRFRPLPDPEAVDILIAGCGTGRVSTEIAQQVSTRGRILAIDLSLASLAYATRQARALGLRRLEYAQADILHLPSLGMAFDLIDVSGVLHHTADPFASWQALVSVLRPGGCMRVGLYSALAREDVVAARDFIAGRGYGATAEDIRACRQEIIRHPDPRVREVSTRGDFFSLSECRDLLFHIQEHRLSLPEINGFLHDNRLEFLGFDLPPATRRAYAATNPGDPGQVDLAGWDRFERSRPETFRGMYQFWVQRQDG